jgi:hypothetical protein
VGKHASLHALIVFRVGFIDTLDDAGERRDETIGHQDAEEGADQRGANQLAQHLRRLGDRAHGGDDTQHRGDDAEGRHAVRHGLDRMGRAVQFLVMGFQLRIDQRLDLAGILGAQRHHAQIVAQELHRVVVLQELGELVEQRAFVRLLDVLFQRQHSLGLGELEELVEHAQQLDIVGLLVGRPLHRAAQALEGLLDVGLGVADDESAEGRAQDNDELDGLNQDQQIAMHRVCAKHACKNDDGPDDDEHAERPAGTSIYLPGKMPGT